MSIRLLENFTLAIVVVAVKGNEVESIGGNITNEINKILAKSKKYQKIAKSQISVRTNVQNNLSF